jgi:hypothetical protein
MECRVLALLFPTPTGVVVAATAILAVRPSTISAACRPGCPDAGGDEASGAFVVSLYPARFAWAARVPVNNAWRAMNSRCPAASIPAPLTHRVADNLSNNSSKPGFDSQ